MRDPTDPSAHPVGGRIGARDAAIGACLLLALSPLLLDWLRHLAAEPWARYAALFPLLFLRAARRDGPVAPGRVPGLVAIGLALAVELVAVGGGETRLGRVALPLAAIGSARLVGIGAWPSLLLLALAVPVPALLLKAPSPELETALARIAAAAVGAGTERVDALALGPADHGLVLAPLLAGLSWYGSLLRDRAPAAAALRAAASALLAIPLQGIALAAALLLAGAAGGPAARAFLSHAPWLVVAVGGTLLAERGARRGPAPPAR